MASTSEKLIPRENSQKDCLRHRLATSIALMMALLASLNVFAATRCNPFGNPPAEVDRGWFARVVTAGNSVCLGGTLLGPWTDGNGDARYACLYEPPRADERGPLPMLVFLHPSETSAYAVILTGLVRLIDKGALREGNPGFILLAPQGRYTAHLYPGYDSNALGWDNWYRQLSPAGTVAVGGAANVAACAHLKQGVLVEKAHRCLRNMRCDADNISSRMPQATTGGCVRGHRLCRKRSSDRDQIPRFRRTL